MLFKQYPFINQRGHNDCAIACLKMIADYYHIKVHSEKLRELAGINQKGTSIYGIVAAAKSVGLISKVVKGAGSTNILSSLVLPCIALVHVDNSAHYIVIYKVKKNNTVVIADPLKGVLRFKVSSRGDAIHTINNEYTFSGIYILFSPNTANHGDNSNTTIIRQFASILKPYKKIITSNLALFFLHIIIEIVATFFVCLFLSMQTDSFDLKLMMMVIMIILLYHILYAKLRAHIKTKISYRISTHMGLNYHSHIMALPMSFFDSRNVAEIYSRFDNISNISLAIAEVVLTVLIDFTLILLGLFLVFMKSGPLFIILCISCCIRFLVFWHADCHFSLYRNSYKGISIENRIWQSIKHILKIKSNTISHTVTLQLKNDIENYFYNNIIYKISSQLQRKAHTIITIVLLVMECGAFYYMLKAGIINIQLLYFSLAFYLFFAESIMNLDYIRDKIICVCDPYNEMKEVIDLASEENPDKLVLSKAISCLEAKDVSFQYGNGGKVLEDLSFSVKAGETIAFVGEFGAGKSTIAKLIMKLYEPTHGNILVDNVPLVDVETASLREHIVYISQELYFFNCTIIEYLTFGITHVKFDDIITATRIAGCFNSINALPLGFQTKLTEFGDNFSYTHRQLLALARAILKKADIYLFDEVVSTLNISIAKKYLCNQNYHPIFIFMTQKLEVIKESDKVFVLKEGKIIETGTHEELEKSKGHYAKLINNGFIF